MAAEGSARVTGTQWHEERAPTRNGLNITFSQPRKGQLVAEEETKDDETPQEEAEAKDTGESPEEAHRAGEFDDVNRKLDDVLSRLDALSSLLVDSRVEDAAEVHDDGDGDDEKLVDLDDIDFE